MRRWSPLALLAICLLSPAAAAEDECKLPLHLWELDLVKVELVSGHADLNMVGQAMGTRALLRGGYQDPAHPRVAARALLLGSTDGVGLKVSAEKTAP